MPSVKQQYDRLSKDREPFLQRARDAAQITIPHLMPPDSQTHGGDLAEAYQSLGARGVNNLSSKLLLALFPVNNKFFRLEVDQGAIVNRAQFRRERAEIEQSLAGIEDMVIDEIEASGLRIKLYQALRQIVCCGNALIHLPANRDPRVFRLDSYVVDRDPRGNIVHVITHQKVSALVLERAIQRRLTRIAPEKFGVPEGTSGDKWFDVYTIAERQADGRWKEWQEIDGKRFANITTHEEDRLPYIPLRMYTTDGESYGRGHVEEHIGDLKALEGLREALVDAALSAAKIIPLVNPDGVARIKALRDAPNGQFIPGKEGDVHFVQQDKFADLRTVQTEVDNLKRDLGLAFLLNTTVQRNAERVTAEEVRLVAQELEDTLGGTFSLLSADLQTPLVDNLLGRMQDEGDIPPLPDMVRPVIVTGLDAIGRGHDLIKMQQLFETMGNNFGPDAMRFVNMDAAWRMAATALGVDTEALIKSQEQMAQEAQQAGMQEGIMKLGPEAMRQFPQQIQAAMAQAQEAAGDAAPAA